MCGIVGFNGRDAAAPILLDGLEKLEYRGYDSAGLAIRNGHDEIEVVKAKGRLKALEEKTDNGRALKGSCGIGHTRWATHGEPSETNAHPHCSADHSLVGVHNGIIENYIELREKLIRNGYVFTSETDTEVAVNLVHYYYNKYHLRPVDALSRAMTRIRGSYALAMLFEDFPEEIYCARKDSPMIIGIEGGQTYLASDVPAILSHCRSVYYIGNMEIARLGKGIVDFYNLDGEIIHKALTEIKWDAQSAEKGGFEHFMIKEIHDQPAAIRDTMRAYIRNGRIDLSEVGLDAEQLRAFSQVTIVACGSSYHVGVAAQYIFESLAEVPVRVELGSEFRYRKLLLDPKGLVIVISQSGETADTVAALRRAEELGVTTLGIVNVLGSTIARESDSVMYTYAGPEIAVATTKAYSTQLLNCYLLATAFAQARGTIDDARCSELIDALETIPDKIEAILADKEKIQWFAANFSNENDVFFIGRNLDYAITLEASLKLKEISYIHSEAYAAGELKHGTISLIEDGTLVIGVLTQEEVYEKTLSNMVEVKSRGAYLFGLTNDGNEAIGDSCDYTIYIPEIDPYFATSLAIIPLQLLSYYIAVARGLDVDKPRNLAKSVTVE